MFIRLEVQRGVKASFVALVPLLVLAGWQNQHKLNPDGIAYLRIAGYYANAQTDLMVSGYWGPLLSWLMVPFLKLGWDPLAAARSAMGVSAIVFWFGCVTVFRSFRIPPVAIAPGAWLAALASVYWSARNISPDLLVGGLMAMAIGVMLDSQWQESRRTAVLAGLLWGLAYLAKAVALPLAFVISAGLIVLLRLARAEGWFGLFRSSLFMAVTFALVAGPWVKVLSDKYGRLTFSTTPRIALALAGPPDQERYHPFARTFHQPEPGRVTQWEDPSGMAYNYWSPLENWGNAQHEAVVVTGNAHTILTLLAGVDPALFLKVLREFTDKDALNLLTVFDLFYLSLGGLVVCLLVPAPRVQTFVEQRWRWALLPVACITGVYLPFYLLREDQRYFYAVYPFLWVAVAGAWHWVAERWQMPGLRFERSGVRLATISFLLPALIWLGVALAGVPNPASVAARELAAKFRAAKLTGPIAGSAMMPGGRAGLYTAYFLGQPWHGDEAAVTPERCRAAHARFIVVLRAGRVALALAADAGFRNLDEQLFPTPGEAQEFPLKVFEVTNR